MTRRLSTEQIDRAMSAREENRLRFHGSLLGNGSLSPAEAVLGLRLADRLPQDQVMEVIAWESAIMEQILSRSSYVCAQTAFERCRDSDLRLALERARVEESPLERSLLSLASS